MATRRKSSDREAETKRWREYRIRMLPEQLTRARLRVIHLEREAERLGLHHLLEPEEKQ